MSLSSMTLFRSRSSPRLNGTTHLSTGSSASSLTSSSSSYGSWSRNSSGPASGSVNNKDKDSHAMGDEDVERTKQLIDCLDNGFRECLKQCDSKSLSMANANHHPPVNGQPDSSNNNNNNNKRDQRSSDFGPIQDRLRVQLERLNSVRDAFGSLMKKRRSVHLMAEAFSSRRSGQLTGALSSTTLNREMSAKGAWRECSAVLATCQRQLRSLMGWWSVRVEDVQGWARVCARDIYEVIIIHGDDRHKARVRIGRTGKDNEWTHREALFKAVDDDVEVRVREVKRAGLGSRHVTLGTKRIPTWPLIAGRPQTLTLSGNASGSVKVIIRIEWSPFLDTVNKNVFCWPEPVEHRSVSSGHLTSSFVAKTRPITPDSGPSRSPDSMPRSPGTASPEPAIVTTPTVDRGSASQRSLPTSSRLSSRQSSTAEPHWPTSDSSETVSVGADDSVLSQLMSSLEDVQGQYQESDDLHDQVKRLWRMRDVEVDRALAEFGFLTEMTDDQNNVNPSPGASDDLQWDSAVEAHLRDSLYHLQFVGSWGLKAKERSALRRIADNAEALRLLMTFEVKLSHRARNVWELVTGQEKKLVVERSLVERSLADRLMIVAGFGSESHEIRSKASESMARDMAPVGDCVTVLQFDHFWRRQLEPTVDGVVQKAVNLVKLTKVRNAHELLLLLNTFKANGPAPDKLVWLIAGLMVSDDHQLVAVARDWLRSACDRHETEITSSLISGLESGSVPIRLGCCRSLAFLHLPSAVESLLHLATDQAERRDVRDEARSCLWTFGDDAQSRYNQCALSSRGFTGIFVQ